MRVSARTFTTLWEAHAWAGVLASLVLFAMFFLGPFALFWKELGPWQEHLDAPATRVSEAALVDVAQRLVQQQAARPPAERPTRLGIVFPDDRVPWMQVQSSGPGGEQVTWLDPGARPELQSDQHSDQQRGQHSDLGYFLFSMHFLDPIPGGKRVAGVAAVVLLFLIATGLIIQIGRLFRELVRFRPRLRARLVWADAHKVAGVLGLPFLVVFAWSGAILCLFSSWLLPAFVTASFAGDAAVVEQAEVWRGPPAATGQPAPAPDLHAALARARAALPDARHTGFVVYSPGDAAAAVDVRGGRDDRLAYHTNVRTSRAGAVQWVLAPDGGNVHTRVRDSLYGLHFASWAGPGIKAVYALLALLGAFCILTGNLIWLARRARLRRLGDVVLARLTAGVCAGLCLAVAAIFAANRVLPMHLADRPRWEHGAFFMAWAGALAYAGLRASAQAASSHLLHAAGALLCAIPFFDALRAGRIPLDPRASSHVFGVELGLLLLGSLLLAAGHLIRNRFAHRERKK